MPRDGSGNFTLVSGNPVVTNTVISSTTQNNTMSDVASGLTQSLSRDGQTTPTADLTMGNFKLRNLANALARTDAATAGQIQDGGLVTLGSVAGTDTITASSAPAITAYTAGQVFRFVSAGANTTNAVTLNINAIGAKNVTKYGANALSKGDIPSGSIVEVVYDGTEFQIVSVFVPQGSYSVRNLNGANNAGTPTTKFDFSADAVVVRSTATGECLARFATGTITCDVTVAAAANGRDQAGAFTASTWVHFYFIWNGSTLATIASAALPNVGPTLPSGYTHWAYIGAIFFNGSSQLVTSNIRGSWVTYIGSPQPVSTTSTSTSPSSVSMTGVVPPNALRYHLYTQGTITAGAGGPVAASLTMQAAAGQTVQTASVTAPASTTAAVNMQADIPNISQTFLYVWGTVTNISTAAYGIYISGYQIPNGGE